MHVELQIIVALIGYMFAVLGIGYWSAKKVKSEADYYIGGNKLPGFALALSERSTDMSGWLLIGMPGLAWAVGLSAVWVLVGTAGGAIFQWVVYSRWFMVERSKTGAITPNDYLAKKFPGGADTIRILGSLTVFLFFVAYVGSQFKAGGKVLYQSFGIEPVFGIFIVAVVVIGYSMAGGFVTVVWTDVLQALLMIFTLVVLPGILFIKVMFDPSLSIMQSLSAAGGGRDLWFGGKEGAASLFLLGANISWFFGYMGGEPHIFVRMMALSDEKQRRAGIVTAIIWGTLTATGAFLLGLLALTLHGQLQLFVADREMILPFMILEHTPAFLAGILLAGSIAALMSTADSQLVVASSAVAEDFYQKVLRKKKTFSEKIKLRISRFTTFGIGILGIILVFSVDQYVYTIVSWGWAGLSGSFAPIMTLTFLWKKFSKAGVIASFIGGIGSTIFWVAMGYDESIITVRLISFPVGFVCAVLASLIWPEEK